MFTHLRRNERAEAAIVDTTGSFSPFRLRDVFVSRLDAEQAREGSPIPRDQSSARSIEARQREAAAMMDRVKVMRVLDLAGVAEAVGEINELWEAYERAHRTPDRPPPRREIPSSQDGDDEAEPMENEEYSPTPPSTSTTTAVGGIGMLIVDHISNVVSSELSHSMIQGALPHNAMLPTRPTLVQVTHSSHRPSARCAT